MPPLISHEASASRTVVVLGSCTLFLILAFAVLLGARQRWPTLPIRVTTSLALLFLFLAPTNWALELFVHDPLLRMANPVYVDFGLVDRYGPSLIALIVALLWSAARARRSKA